MTAPWDRLYEPPPVATPWPLRPVAGGLTPVAIFAAFVLSIPVVVGGVLLAWEVFVP